MTFPAYALDLVCGEEASEHILKMLTRCLKVKVFIGTHLGLAHLQKRVEKSLCANLLHLTELSLGHWRCHRRDGPMKFRGRLRDHQNCIAGVEIGFNY
jgi:hypothetical protein